MSRRVSCSIVYSALAICASEGGREGGEGRKNRTVGEHRRETRTRGVSPPLSIPPIIIAGGTIYRNYTTGGTIRFSRSFLHRGILLLILFLLPSSFFLSLFVRSLR